MNPGRGKTTTILSRKPLVAMVCAGFLVTTVHGQTGHSGSHGEPPEFCVTGLPPMPNSFKELNPDDVKRFWINQLPSVYPPRRSSPGYSYDMAAYRERLDARNCLVEKIRNGTLDEKAAAEALRHNIRHYRNRGNEERVRELEFELLRREAIHRGDLGAVVKLEELRQHDREQLEFIIRQQCRTIEFLQAEVDRLRRQE